MIRQFLFFCLAIVIWVIEMYLMMMGVLMSHFSLRCGNSEPLMYLYRGEPLEVYQLRDDFLDKRLQIYGYSGIEEMDLYILDYFNHNYGTHYMQLEQLDSALLEKMYPFYCGTYTKETRFSMQAVPYQRYL